MRTLTFTGSRAEGKWSWSNPEEAHLDLSMVRQVTREVVFTDPYFPNWDDLERFKRLKVDIRKSIGGDREYAEVTMTKLDEWWVLDGPAHETIVEMWKQAKSR